MTADLHPRLVRALEAEYANRVTGHCAAGASPDEAHARAFSEIKMAATAMLRELVLRGYALPLEPGLGPVPEPLEAASRV